MPQDLADIDPAGAAIVLAVVYFFPTVLAVIRRHHQRWAIFMVDLLLGWSIIGWVAALIWACTAKRQDA